MLTAWILLFTASLAIWLSSEYAIVSARHLARSGRLSKFFTSLFVVGFITSLPEIGIVLNSLFFRAPQIALGNLIGSQFFILFMIFPVLSLLLHGLRLQSPLRKITLALVLLLVLVPLIALLDQRYTVSEVVVVVIVYAILLLRFAFHPHIHERFEKRLASTSSMSLPLDIVKLIGSTVVILLATNSAVRSIVELAGGLQTSRFLLSMLLLPISTNLSELRFALEAKRENNQGSEIADFIGSLSFNSLLIALLVIATVGGIFIAVDITAIIVLLLIGCILFWWFCFTREFLNTAESVVLVLISVLFFGFVLAIDWHVRLEQFF